MKVIGNYYIELIFLDDTEMHRCSNIERDSSLFIIHELGEAFYAGVRSFDFFLLSTNKIP